MFDTAGGAGQLRRDTSNVHGKPVVMLLACHSGDPADAARQLAPIKPFGKPVGDVLQRRPYVTQQSLLTEEETADRVAAAYGRNLAPLAEIKARWDRTNLFRVNKNVAPAAP